MGRGPKNPLLSVQELPFVPDAALQISFYPGGPSDSHLRGSHFGEARRQAATLGVCLFPSAGRFSERHARLLARLTDYTCSSSSADASVGC